MHGIQMYIYFFVIYDNIILVFLINHKYQKMWMFAKRLLYLSNIHQIWTHFLMMFVRLHLVTSNFHGNRMNIFLPFRSWKLYGISKILTIHCYKKLHPFWCSKNALTTIVYMFSKYIDVVFIYLDSIHCRKSNFYI